MCILLCCIKLRQKLPSAFLNIIKKIVINSKYLYIKYNSILDLFFSDDVAPPIILEISVYDVSVNSVEIDWNYKEDKLTSNLSCELVYGPVDDASQVQVFTQIQLLNDHIIKLSHLENNVTYHMHMVCHNFTGEKIESNVLQFTTGMYRNIINHDYFYIDFLFFYHLI